MERRCALGSTPAPAHRRENAAPIVGKQTSPHYPHPLHTHTYTLFTLCGGAVLHCTFLWVVPKCHDLAPSRGESLD